MKTYLARLIRRSLALSWILLAGCQESVDTPSTQPNPSLRGQPILVASKSPSPATERTTAEPAATAPVASSSSSATVEIQAAPEEVGSTDQDLEFLTVTFEKLSGYEIEINEANLNPPTQSASQSTRTAAEQIPESIKKLDQRRVAVRGFMLPLKVEGGLVTELLIMKDQSMCCYGTTPRINEWISVKMLDEGVKPLMDQPVTLYGKLNVGEMRENGYLVGIYSMDGESMAGPLDF